jgi:bifunctional UDP-N-acetylglucosamine pyrophosphorylase/glucosamine-1-phosphate N-acetyltransferase
MEDIYCVILAAGLGKRLGGELPKAITMTRQGTLIDLVLTSLSSVKPKKTVIVTGHKRELVESHLAASAASRDHVVEFAYQSEQLGTGHAARCALPLLQGCNGTVIITYADHPLFTQSTLEHFLAFHAFKKATLTMISFTAPPPNGYGRIIRGTRGEVLSITEAKDCSPEQLLISEVNSGVYAVDSAFLKPALEALTNENAQREYYLTDIVAKASSEGQTVCAFPLGDATEAAGVNNRADLAFVNSVLSGRQIRAMENSGVIFDSPASCSIEPLVTIQPGARIGPNVQLQGNTSIAEGVIIEGSSLIIDSSIGRGVVVKHGCRIEGAIIGSNSSVGPFANVRPETTLGAEVRIGNFVEVKNATLNDGAKASHLTYLGDCTVGANSNIGAGTITCNYDGYSKSKTTIGDNVFIGSNSCLVAPLTIGDGALVAAGSAITSDVPADALALGRATQTNKQGWAKVRRERLESTKKG